LSISQKAIALGAVLMLLAVGIGAFGAHAFNQLLVNNGRTDIFDTASKYHFYHGLGLLVVGIILDRHKQLKYTNIIVNLLFYGVIIFSGSLYLLAIFNITWMGAVTPIGGICLLFAWGLLGVSLIKLSEC